MTSTLKTWLYPAIVAGTVALLISGAAWVHDAGQNKERAVWQAKEAERAIQLTKALQAEYERGRRASQKYQLAASALQTSYLNLEGPSHDLRQRVSLVLPPVAVARNRDRLPGAPGHVTERQSTDAPAPGQEQRGDVPRSDRLSLAAVWLWNGALTGADVPAGACGLADTSSEACAADSGLIVDDAWDNQALNAKSCAADRLRHRSLIEFLTERPAE
ncbi:hypothetical protein [Variovorax paradoxus]|uniref:hypothetical protein n=1 Tax=Variovorax paradoxus TaxID=34073 RepID=UPI000AD956A1|nr:hypothetical protein [Variovorax paradoxus]